MAAPSIPLMIDSEGAGSQIGLIVAADDHGYVRVLKTGKPITTLEVFEFICSLPEDRLLVGFSLGYDYAMWLRDLPLDAKRRIVYGFNQFVRFGDFEIKLFSTELTVRKVSTDTTRTVSDIFKFYQSSFLAAIGHSRGGWGAARPDELALITEGKEGRGGFTWDVVMEPKTLEYCKAECVVGARMAKMTFDALNGLNEGELQRYFGAGSGAKMVLHHRAFDSFLRPEGEEIPGTTEGLKVAIRRAMIGGRFESAYFGPLDIPLYEHDIASAYPAFYEKLICQRHARWVARDTGDHNALVEVSWELPHGTLWGPFPVRDRNGVVTCPRQGSGVYWGHEVQAAEAAFPGTIRRHRVASMVTACECDVASWVPKLMQRRFQLADKNSGEGLAIKLVANALFGNTAQSIGSQRFTSLIWAGQITASARAQLLDGARRVRPDQVVMMATDALYTTVPVPDLDTREMTLGAWEVKEFPNGAFILAPGVAVFPKAGADGEAVLKTRGMEKKAFRLAAPEMMEAWKLDGPNAKVAVKLSRFIGMRAGLVRPELYGTWEDQERVVSIGSGTKREHPPVIFGQWPEPYLTVAPRGGRAMSEPHHPPKRRSYSERDPDSELFADDEGEAA